MASLMLYLPVAEGSHFSVAAVKTRKAPSASAILRPFAWKLRDSLGQDASIIRHTVTEETYSAWLAEEDADKRAAILGAGITLEGSRVNPSTDQIAAMRELYASRCDGDTEKGRQLLADEMSRGVLVLPSTSRAKSGASRSDAVIVTESERTTLALDAMFASVEPEPEPVVENRKGAK